MSNFSVDLMKNYPNFQLNAEETVFLQRYLAALIETRAGSIKASEAQGVGQLHNKVASYIQQIVDCETRKQESRESKTQETKTYNTDKRPTRLLTTGLPAPKLNTVVE
jgi:hypothetical protein